MASTGIQTPPPEEAAAVASPAPDDAEAASAEGKTKKGSPVVIACLIYFPSLLKELLSKTHRLYLLNSFEEERRKRETRIQSPAQERQQKSGKHQGQDHRLRIAPAGDSEETPRGEDEIAAPKTVSIYCEWFTNQ